MYVGMYACTHGYVFGDLYCNLKLHYFFCYAIVPALAIGTAFSWFLCPLGITTSLYVCLVLQDTTGSFCIFLSQS